jgi:hypothetical protein
MRDKWALPYLEIGGLRRQLTKSNWSSDCRQPISNPHGPRGRCIAQRSLVPSNEDELTGDCSSYQQQYSRVFVVELVQDRQSLEDRGPQRVPPGISEHKSG